MCQQSNLSAMYFQGTGVEKNEVEAFRWTRRAAEQGDVQGMAQLGRFYCDGIGTPEDDEQAAHWTAADQGDGQGRFAWVCSM